MATVDFSNATLTKLSTFDMTQYKNIPLGLNSFLSWAITDSTSSTTSICSNLNKMEDYVSEYEYHVIYTGVLNTSGTEMYIYDNGVYQYKISGISYDSGDVFTIQFTVKIVIS